MGGGVKATALAESQFNCPSDSYGVNDISPKSGNTTWIGKQDKDARWMVMKIDETTGADFGYATTKNNSSVTSYSSAWTNKATLTYNDYEVAF